MVQNNEFYGFNRSVDPMLKNKTRSNHICGLTGTKNTYSTISQPMVDACLLYARMETGTDCGGVGKKQELYMAELKRNDGDYDIAIFDQETGQISAAVYNPVTKDVSNYRAIQRGGEKGHIIYLALMPMFLQNNEFQDHIKTLKDYPFLDVLFNGIGEDEALHTLAILCDVIYRMLNEEIITVEIPADMTFPKIRKQALSRGSYKPDQTVAGSLKVFMPVIERADSISVFSGNEAKYEVKPLNSGREFSDEEKALIPAIPATYVMPEQVVYFQTLMLETTGSPNPVRTIMGRGESGTGKTKGMMALASILNLPYLHFTCGADTELADLQGMMLPVTQDDKSDMSGLMINGQEIPGTDDIVYNPMGTYQKVFGKEPGKKPVEEIMEDLFKHCMEMAVSSCHKQDAPSQQGYRFTDTDIIRAIEHGYLVELQEPAAIMQQGVLVSLNSVTEPDGSIRLANGKLIKRHPDTVICYTTNIDYEGLRPINQSVLDRVQHLIDFEMPSDAAMIERCINLSGLHNREVVENMLHTVQEMEAHCKSKMVLDGIIGPRSFYNWATGAKVTKRPYLTGMTAVVSKATANKTVQAELKSILEQHFTPNERIA